MRHGTERQVRRREIRAGDLTEVTDLLGRGFPGRARPYWERGLRRTDDRPIVEGCPRYGFLLKAGGTSVGVSLTLFEAVPRGHDVGIRCNPSSWIVDPSFRMQAALHVASMLRRRDVTFVNISPAAHTWTTLEAQGFRAYVEGQVVVAPVLSRHRLLARVSARPEDWRDLPEPALLDDHQAYGCTRLTVDGVDNPQPFVFLPFRARSGRLPLPLMQLIFTLDVGSFSRFTYPLGSWLLSRCFMGVVLEGEPVPDGPPVSVRSSRLRRYAKGPNPPRCGDLTYTERVLFGP